VAQASSRQIFYLIVIAQFCGTSVWFAGNAVLPQLSSNYQWPATSLAYLTSSTQLGFILGTLTFALLGATDRFSPSKVFFASSILASAFNASMLLDTASFPLILSSRLLVGVCLAGIYPVGMKIAADWNENGLGHWLGALVGALVLGTAFPHSLKFLSNAPDVKNFTIIVSLLCASGGLLVFVFVADGPFRKASTHFSFSAITKAFSAQQFRAPALGYFGHMWELYAMWAFIPAVFTYYGELQSVQINTSALAFVTIGSGAAGCYFGGILSARIGSATVAVYALAASGLCCLLSCFAWNLPPLLFFGFMTFWGIVMAADSPQFSALVASHAPPHVRGSAITIVVCIGFAITIASIQLIAFLKNYMSFQYIFLTLLPGPLLGTLAMRKFSSGQTIAKSL
jgi:MFS family permease